MSTQNNSFSKLEMAKARVQAWYGWLILEFGHRGIPIPYINFSSPFGIYRPAATLLGKRKTKYRLERQYWGQQQYELE
jgi:hypothetical protein